MSVPDDRLHRAWPALVGIALGVGVIAAHGGGLHAVFQYDDKVEILTNPNMQGLGHWRELWTYNPFRFVLLSTFALQYNLTGADTAPFHVVNLLIHWVNALLVTVLAGRLFGSAGPEGLRRGWSRRIAALASGLLFAVHPLLVEGVTYISGRSSSLATLVVLVALLVHDDLLRHERDGPQRAARFRGLARRISLVASAVVGAVVAGLVAASLAGGEGGLVEGRALPLGIGVAVLLLGGAGAALRPLLRRPLPGSPPVRGLLLRWGALGLLFVVGALTKEIVVTLPVALWLWALCTTHEGRVVPALRTIPGLYLPFLALPLGLVIARVAYYGHLLAPDAIRTPWTNLWTQAEVVWNYLFLFAWPVGQSVFHHYPESSGLWSWPTYAAVLAWIAVVFFAIELLRRQPALAFVLLWSGVALLPTSSVIPLRETMAEHRTYLPASAWCMAPVLIGAWLPGLRGRPWIAAAVVAVLCVPLAIQAAAYTRQWHSEESLWSHAAEHNPEAEVIWYQLGEIAMADGRLAEAEQRYRRCLDLAPAYYDAASNLGLVLAIRGDLDGAEAEFRRAVRVSEALGVCDVSAYNNLANAAYLRGNLSETVRIYQHVVVVCDADNFIAHLGLGNLYYEDLRNRGLALHHYREALRIAPGHPAAEILVQRVEELSW